MVEGTKLREKQPPLSPPKREEIAKIDAKIRAKNAKRKRFEEIYA
jgi:hypothetical protein